MCVCNQSNQRKRGCQSEWRNRKGGGRSHGRGQRKERGESDVITFQFKMHFKKIKNKYKETPLSYRGRILRAQQERSASIAARAGLRDLRQSPRRKLALSLDDTK